jgi:hypothetical protein
MNDIIVDAVVDEKIADAELREESHADCSWCTNQGTVWLMGQLFCETCADEYRALHAKVSGHNYYEPEKR